MTRKMDFPGTRTSSEALRTLATFARLTAVTLAIPAALALIQVTGRVLTGEFPIARGTWAFDLIYIYVSSTQRIFDDLSPKKFGELDPAIQGLLVFIPNLVLVLLGTWSLISLRRHGLER